MNLRIEFYQGNTEAANYNQALHTITEPHSLTLSKLGLQSVSNYTREPRRCVFSMYLDDFLRDCVLNPSHEHTRYISHYEVRIFQDDALIFTGIIDTSATTHDLSTDVVKITAYDKIKLLSIFSDLEQYYGLSAGYYPAWILMYFVQNIERTIPVHIPLSTGFIPPQINPDSGEAILLAPRIDYGDLFRVPPASHGWTFYLDATSSPQYHNNLLYGYRMDPLAGRATFVFCCRTILARVAGEHTHWQARHQASIITLFNGICPVQHDYRQDSAWVDSWSELEDTIADLEEFFVSHGTTMPTEPLPLTASTEQLHYITVRDGFPDPFEPWPPENLSRLWVEPRVYGNIIPQRIQPGTAYETLTDAKTNILSVLQATLMLYNATIVASPDGTLSLLRKERLASTTTDVDSDDVISISKKREDAQHPDTKTIDVLAGDTQILQYYIQKNLMEFFTHKTRIELTLDKISKYPLNLSSKIRLKHTNYLVIEVTPDFAKDNQKVVAWQL